MGGARDPHPDPVPHLPHHGNYEYLRNRGTPEIAQQMANHKSLRTTHLYDRRNDQVGLSELEWILL